MKLFLPRQIRWAAGLLLMVSLLLALPLPLRAQPAGSPIVVRDDRGTEYRFTSPPQRIITMLPSLTESLWALGGGPRLVGIDSFSNWPAELNKLPRLGGLEDARIEAIAALKPDVVLASSSSRAMDRVEALGIRVLRLKSESYADVRRTLNLLAQLLGTPAEGERLWTRLEQELETANRRIPDKLRGQKVYFEIGGGPYAAGTSSFIGETLGRLGLANIVPAKLGPFPKLNPEFVVRAQPDLIMGVQREQLGIAGRPGWATMAAVRDKRMCGFDSAQYDMLVRPGPRLGEGAALLADCLEKLK